MNHPPEQSVSLTETKRVEALARVLFSSAKLRWGWAVGISYSAVGIVPVAFLLDGEKWPALVAAAVVSLVAAGLRWWSEAVRGDADRLHRMHDISVNLGQLPDREVVADVEARRSRLTAGAETVGLPQLRYFEATDTPSPHLLVVNMRESSWWTAQLADTAKRIVYIITSVASVVPFCLLVLADSVLLRAYGITICVVVLMDMFHLGVSYGRLSTACNSAFSEFGALAKDDALSERHALLAATNYHFIRRGGPLVPDWLWRIRREKLNTVWGQFTYGRR